MSEAEVLVKCEGLGKTFCRDLKRSLWYGLRDSVGDILSSNSTRPPQQALRPGEFWANRDINFQLARGECLGLIGGNGAGKTTLLKIINGLLKPDVGQIKIRGRMSALIALGAGFNPVLTGRENIFINGSILGLSRAQIREKIEEIVEFADVADSIDSPVRTYSSGMQIRLGFAVAVILIQPDVLLLDEVLAVGDVGFRLKCYNRISSLLERSAVIFVSHARVEVSRICTKLLALQHGEVWFAEDSVSDGLRRFEKALTSDEVTVEVFGEDTAKFIAFRSHKNDESTIQIDIELEASRAIANPDLMITLLAASGEAAAQIHGGHIAIQKGAQTLQVMVPRPQLASGDYRVTVSLHDRGSGGTGVVLAVNRGNFTWSLERRTSFEFATTVLQGSTEVFAT